MAVIPCAGCSRFVNSDAHRCPFCDTIQRAAVSPLRPAVTSMILGLTLAACGTLTIGDGATSTGTGTSSGTTSSTGQ